jgi:hypothetical protein
MLTGFLPQRLSPVQAGAQTVSCDATLSKQVKDAQQMSGNTFPSTDVLFSQLSISTYKNAW